LPQASIDYNSVARKKKNKGESATVFNQGITDEIRTFKGMGELYKRIVRQARPLAKGSEARNN